MKKATKAHIKYLRDLLRDKKTRDEENVFVAEGIKIIKDILSGGNVVDTVLVSSGISSREQVLIDHIEGRGIPVLCAGENDVARLSSLRTPPGILAVVKRNIFSLKDLKKTRPSMIVLCDGVQDPGNLGAIIRNSAAFGAFCVLLTGESVDVYNPKVVRASSGTVLSVPALACSYKEVTSLQKDGYKLLVSHMDPHTAESIKETGKIYSDLSDHPLILAFGSEGQGVSKEIVDRADSFFHISISDKVESLNVTSASAITLYEFSKFLKNAR